jgi:hypothetical protein
MNKGRFALLPFAILICVSALLGQSTSVLTSEHDVALVNRVAESWVSLLDTGLYDESWERSGAIFRARVDKELWIKQLKMNRETLGKLRSRKLLSATYLADLPDSPRGDYVILEYAVSFEHDASGREIIIPYLTEDGDWSVAGYYLK